MIVLLCTLASGAMFYLSQGLDDVWWLAWFAPAPLLWLAYGECRSLKLFAASFLAFAAGQIYMIQAYGGELPWIAIALMMLGFGALFAGAIGRARTAYRALPASAALFAFPAIWTGIEFVYSLLSPHGTFGSLAYSQVSWPLALQIAALLGVHAITFIICLFANALALAGRGAGKPAMGGILVCILAIIFGQQRLSQPDGPSITAASMADGAARQRAVRKLDFASTHAMAERYAEEARRQADRGARLIVIPEAAMVADPSWGDAALMPLARTARDKQVTIVTGVVLVKPWRNAALAFMPDGTVRAYDKRHLLPPGEDRFVPGKHPGHLGGGEAVALCKDLDFPRTLSADARTGLIRILAVPANDFGEDGWIHARMAVMRGVENGFAVVRSAFNGVETISDAQGRVRAGADTVGKGMTVIRARVPLGAGATLYTRIGDAFGWIAMAAGLVFAAAARIKRTPGRA
jgi:apolipoprotein N-acyltransferase